MINNEKRQKLEEDLKAAGILPEDLQESFILGSGRGGQKQNKTSNAVYLKHLPSGLDVKCQKSRSQEDNRFFARRLLLEKILALQGIKTRKMKEEEKIKKQKQRRKRRAAAPDESMPSINNNDTP